MKPDVEPRNIVTVFHGIVADELIAKSREIASVVPSKIVLNTTDMLPHMTIYTTNFPQKHMSEVIQRLSQIAAQTKSFPILFNRAVIDMQTIFLNAHMTEDLYMLHERIVDSLNELRNGLYDEGELSLIGDDERRKKSLLTYGMWAAKELYIPHSTLSRPFDSARCNDALAVVGSEVHIETVIETISLVIRGPNGTCKEILETFSLSGR